MDGPRWADRTHNQGETRVEVLSTLDAVLEAIENDAGRPPSDEEPREAGIDPEVKRRSGDGELTAVLE